MALLEIAADECGNAGSSQLRAVALTPNVGVNCPPRHPWRHVMAHLDWSLEGEWMKNCNCAFGCPCDFNAKPTNGHCEGLLGMRITHGHVGDVNLDGLSFFA